MIKDAHAQQKLSEFLKGIQAMSAGYQQACFSYLAFKKGDYYVLQRGELMLVGGEEAEADRQFTTERVHAGRFPLSRSGMTPEAFLTALVSDRFSTPHGDLSFPAEPDRGHSVYGHPEMISSGDAQQLHQTLTIQGDRCGYQGDRAELDWELMGGNVPYDGLPDLCREFGLAASSQDYLFVKVTASHIARMGSESRVSGSEAKLVLTLNAGLDRHRTTFGYRVIHNHEIVQRGAIPMEKFCWTTDDARQHGETKLPVPAGAVVHCLVSYAGRLQYHCNLQDPARASNPRRVAFQTFDTELAKLKEVLTNPEPQGKDAKKFEAGVAWLLWMIGFNGVHLDGASMFNHVPDLLLATPQGRFAAVECTVGHLREDSKLLKLVERAKAIEARLSEAGINPAHVLPILVTSKSREAVKGELKAASEAGVHVLTRENLEAFSVSSLSPLNADRIYEEALNEVRSQQESGLMQLRLG